MHGEGQALALRAPSGRRGFKPRLPEAETREVPPTGETTVTAPRNFLILRIL